MDKYYHLYIKKAALKRLLAVSFKKKFFCLLYLNQKEISSLSKKSKRRFFIMNNLIFEIVFNLILNVVSNCLYDIFIKHD